MSYRPTSVHDVYHYSYTSPSSYGHQNYLPDGNGLCTGEESNYWTNSSPRSDTPSPSVNITRNHSYHSYTPYGATEVYQTQYRTGYNLGFTTTEAEKERQVTTVPYVRVVKRRTTANKKERRRTQSINNAYADLRDCIPNIPADSKLSKIKTLRLATSYISYLTAALETDQPAGGFKVELTTNSRSKPSTPVQPNDCSGGPPDCDVAEGTGNNSRRTKGRTGWPQHVWALELKQEQAL